MAGRKEQFAYKLDFNTFVTLLIAIIPVVWKSVKRIKLKIEERKEKKMFELYHKKESDNFYIFVMLTEAFVVGLSGVIAIIIDTAIAQLASFTYLKINLHYEALAVISGSVCTLLIIEKMNWGRKRLIGDKEGKIIVFCSALLINMWAVFVKLEGNIQKVSVFLIWLYLVNEIIGLLYFQGRYTKYDFSSLTLYLNNGEKIVCDNIEKINRKKNYIIIENHDRNIVLQYDQIWRVEYYGAPKYILNNDSEKQVIQLFKKMWKR